MSDMVCRKSMMRCQTPGMCSPHGGCRDEVTTAKDRQISALIAENERLTNSLHEAREDRNKLGDRYDAVNAEVAGLRTGYEAYEQVNAELKAEVEGLRKRIDDMSPFKGAPFTGPDLKCLACGGYHYGLSGLPCPKFRNTAQSDLPETRSGQIGAPMGKGEQS